MIRRQEECPGCRKASAVFRARRDAERAIYVCADSLCGLMFVRAHPKPLLRAFVAPTPIPRRRLWRPVKARVESVREARGA